MLLLLLSVLFHHVLLFSLLKLYSKAGQIVCFFALPHVSVRGNKNFLSIGIGVDIQDLGHLQFQVYHIFSCL